jgi:hypothetical protein
MDLRGLLLASGVLRYTLAPFGTSVFYRGQSKDWVAQVSLMRGASSRAETQARLKWLEQALGLVATVRLEGRFRTDGLEATDTVDTNHAGAAPCRYIVGWQATKQGSPNVIPG